MTKPNIPQILGVFDEVYDQWVSWKINSSYRKYATARDELIAEFSKKTGLKEEVFNDHLAIKQARAMGVL